MKSFKVFLGLLVALSFLPSLSAADRWDRRNNNYDNGYYRDSYNNNSYGHYRDNSYNNGYYRNDRGYYGNNSYGYDRPYRSPGKSAAIVGGSAAAGAVIGGLAHGGAGAAVGAIVGGVGGLIYDQATKHHDRRY